MNIFSIPRDIYWGKGCTEEALSNLSGKSAVVVNSASGFQQPDYLSKITAGLRKAKIGVHILEGLDDAPTMETVRRGAQEMCRIRPDWIVAAGDGPTIDAAKAMWIFYEYPGLSFNDVKTPFSLPPLRQKARLIAIPTTSGNASEITAFSAVSDCSTKMKHVLVDYALIPDIALLDPDLTAAATPESRAHNGMDALAHALEAYVSSGRSPLTSTLAIQASTNIWEALPKAVQGAEKERAQLHFAQCVAGMACSNAGLGIAHSMAHKIETLFQLPHGCVVAILLPYVIEFNQKKVAPLYADMAAALSLPGTSPNEKTKPLACLLQAKNQELDIPLTLQDAGIPYAMFNELRESIAAAATKDPCTGANPRIVTKQQLVKLFEYAYYGKKVDF